MENQQLPTTFKGIVHKGNNKVELTDITHDLNNIDDDYAVIKIKTAGFGPYDLGFLIGRLKTHLTDYNIGCEGCGTVIKLGKNGDPNLLGKRVSFLAHYDDEKTIRAFAEYSVVPIKSLVPLPDNVDDQQGAYLLGNPLTAISILNSIILKNSCKAIVADCAGSALIKIINKLCKVRDIKVINIVRKEENIKLLNDLGFEHVLNSSNSAFGDDLKKLSDEIKPSIYLTCLGGFFPESVFSRLPPRSTMVCIGNMNNEKLGGFASTDFIFQDKSITGFQLFNYLKSLSKEEHLAHINSVMENISKDGACCTDINKEFSFNEFEEALKEYQTNMSKGKIVLKP
jgi:NADPH2:quinone reductase